MSIIEFIPSALSVVEQFSAPIPASQCLPEWYKNQTSLSGDKLIMHPNGVYNGTIKKCMPVLDDITAGYIIKLESDIIVDYEPGSNFPKLHWSYSCDKEIIGTHSTDQVSHFPVPNGYSAYPFKFNNYWRIKTPPGYSCMFRHPFYHVTDQPFYCLSGIVDTDLHPIAINFPFFIKENFVGVIPFKTPIIQIIPFKREEWEMKVCVDQDNESGIKEYYETTKKIMHRYKDNWRSVKSWK